MKIDIVSVTVVREEHKRANGLRAVASVRLEDAVIVRNCALMETADGFHVAPPMKVRGESPVAWARGSAFAQELAGTLRRAYEALI